MIIALDTAYSNTIAATAGVYFDDWQSASPERVFISHTSDLQDYQSGQFYKRELPCIVQLLKEHSIKPEINIIDGNVFLDHEGRPGLGKHLYDELKGCSQIVGVAKNRFKSLTEQNAVYRATSKNPIYVTSTIEELEQVKINVQSMHGNFRIPTMLKMADSRCRDALTH